MARPVDFRLFIVMMLALAGCTDNPHLIDLSGSEVTVELKRLDKDLFELKSNEVEDTIHTKCWSVLK